MSKLEDLLLQAAPNVAKELRKLGRVVVYDFGAIKEKLPEHLREEVSSDALMKAGAKMELELASELQITAEGMCRNAVQSLNICIKEYQKKVQAMTDIDLQVNSQLESTCLDEKVLKSMKEIYMDGAARLNLSVWRLYEAERNLHLANCLIPENHRGDIAKVCDKLAQQGLSCH